MSTVALILASGLDERMNSALPPTLHPVLGDPCLLWVLRALPPSVSEATVLCPEADAVQAALEGWKKKELLTIPVCVCREVPEAIAGIERADASKVLVLSGETPLLDPDTLERLAAQDQAAASPGAQLLPWATLKGMLARQQPAALREAVQAACAQAARVEPRSHKESRLLITRRDQAALQVLARDQINGRWMDAGVSFLDPSTTYVGPRVVLSPDVFLEPGVRLEGKVCVGRGTRIAQGSLLKDCTVGENVEIKAYTVAQEAIIGRASIVGPFARLREGSLLEERVHVGNFVETKKSTLKAGAKANHLSYVGDTEVGEGTNIGAGLITCNYDGFRKHRTIIGKNVFVGSDCQLVAPVKIGDGALLGAGSTITEDIPAQALAFTRAPLVVKEGGAERLRDRIRAELG